VALSGNYAFIADGGRGLSVIDVADSTYPELMTNLNIGDYAYGIAIAGNYAYLSDGLASLMVIDISNPLDLRRVGGNTAFDALYPVTIYSNRVYAPTGIEGLQILDVYQPPAVSNTLSIITQPQSVTRSHGQHAYFGVSVSGASPIQYQWRKNGVPLSGATNSIYSFLINSSTLSDEGDFDVVITNNFSSITSAVATLKVIAGITVSNLRQTYDGNAKPVAVTTSPTNLSVSVTYNSLTAAPTNAGPYTVVVTSLDSVFKGSVTNTLAISPAPAIVLLSSLLQNYDGLSHPVTYATIPTNLPLRVTYNNSTNPPINAGNYKAATTSLNSNYSATTNSTLVIAKASATVTLSNLVQAYTGTPRPVSYSTVPSDLLVKLTYNGVITPPVNLGAYPVVGTISNANYSGSATNTLKIVTPPVNISLIATGSVLELSFTGMTNVAYVLQRATNLATTAQWQNLITNNPAANGIWHYIETNLIRSQQYYRAVGP